MKIVGARIPVALHKLAKKVATDADVTFAQLVQDAIVFYLQRKHGVRYEA